ncbi:hypothetical protein [uncultured Brevundimonas sp.]|uniref:hypothetical protein n=1 Tax=uncultured Brevundimonas sp. TaxID=213418 RepID=UPI00261CD312|nr:hypothetical protein [uncultured Brevundimonas sp.]
MSFSLSAPPPPITPSPRRQRGLLLAASAVVHILVLVPVALNTVFIPSFSEDDPSFEVLIDMTRDFVRPEPKPKPQPVERVQDQAQSKERPQDRPKTVPQETPQDTPQERRIEQIEAAKPQQDLSRLDARLPELATPQAEQPREALDADNRPAAVNDLNTPALPTLTAPVTRPVIEAIDGPMASSQSIAPADARVPALQSAAQADRAGESGQADVGAPDTPVPRRARLDEDAEAALAAAARGGALDDAWTYRPEAGGAAGGGGTAGAQAGASGRGPDGNNTATSTGRIYYGGRTTPVDCTQPQMLSDIQRLSCDSAEARRLRQSAESGIRVGGNGNAARDGQMSATGARRIQRYEELRRPLGGGVGVSQGSMQGGSGQGEILDDMSGTTNEIRKLQEQIGASNGPRAPARND